MAESMAPRVACSFEVFGKVQKVFFRKYTAECATNLHLRGWVMNTSHGTVVGQMEGPADKVQQMKHWLEKEGSPKSVIERVVFTEEKEIEAFSFPSFEVRR